MPPPPRPEKLCGGDVKFWPGERDRPTVARSLESGRCPRVETSGQIGTLVNRSQRELQSYATALADVVVPSGRNRARSHGERGGSGYEQRASASIDVPVSGNGEDEPFKLDHESEVLAVAEGCLLIPSLQ